MPRRSLSLVYLLLLAVRVVAQQPDAALSPDDDHFLPYAVPAEEPVGMLSPDSALFYRAIQSAPDLYGRITDYRLSFVASKRRGMPWSAESASVEGLNLPYRYFPALRALGASERAMAGLASVSGTPGGAGGVREFRLTDGILHASSKASLHFTDRNYLFGAKLSASRALSKGWSAALAFDARTGRDAYIDGVFTNSFCASLRAAKRWTSGHALDLVLVVPPSMRGLRSSAAQETFRLTGDPLYNPAWGFQRGKVRNSHVRREFVPLLLAAGEWVLSSSTRLSASAGAEYGPRKYSSLGWYDARTPMPDNYRWLPSYSGDAAADAAWRHRDPHYTQIDWDELIRQNRLADGHAVYALEDRVDRNCNVHLNALFATELDARLTLRYGLFATYSDTRSYKQMRDLLGAQHITDIDQYLVDDDTYSNLLQNDLRHPSRTIRTGDRFGYDYALTSRSISARLLSEYRSDRFRADVAVELGRASISRRGYYEKELFSGARSYGPSRRLRFMPYTLKAQAGYSFSPRSYLGVSALAAAQTPAAEDLFFQPQYNNRTVDYPVAVKTYAVELNYRLTAPAITVEATFFSTLMLDNTQTRRYFDDMAGVFSNLAASGIGTLSYGLEASADIRLSYRWRLSLAASAGRYKYCRDPRITVLSDVDNSVVDDRAVSHMGGCVVGGAPQLTACAEFAYFGPKGWGVRASGAYAGSRYVEPALLRRTQRIARQGGASPEAFDAFTRQERLGDVFRVDASLFKSFYFEHSRLTAFLSLRNLLGDRNAVYGGYESLRIFRSRVEGANSYRPQATRYTHAYPRSFYLSVTYSF